jgi:hypothetical protein
MTAEELANKFKQKVSAAVVEKDRQDGIASDNLEKRTADIEHCRCAMEREVIPFLEELKHHLGSEQFSFATQIELSRRVVYRRCRLADDYHNIVVTRVGDSGTQKGVPFVYAPDAEPYISNSGDLTRDKMAKLIEMVIDD